MAVIIGEKYGDEKTSQKMQISSWHLTYLDSWKAKHVWWLFDFAPPWILALNHWIIFGIPGDNSFSKSARFPNCRTKSFLSDWILAFSAWKGWRLPCGYMWNCATNVMMGALQSFQIEFWWILDLKNTQKKTPNMCEFLDGWRKKLQTFNPKWNGRISSKKSMVRKTKRSKKIIFEQANPKKKLSSLQPFQPPSLLSQVTP